MFMCMIMFNGMILGADVLHVIPINNDLMKNLINTQSAAHGDFESELQKDPGFVTSIVAREPAKYCLSGVPKHISVEHYLTLLKRLYNQNALLHDKFSRGQSKITKLVTGIPKIIHHIWFGSAEFPELYKTWRASWQHHHPGWEMILWNEEKIKKEFSQGLFNQSFFDEAQKNKNYSRMSDIARYEILAKYGGLYVDTDTHCNRSFDDLHEAYDFYGCMEPWNFGGAIASAVVAACPEHPVIKRCMQLMKFYQHNLPQDLIKEFTSFMTDDEAINVVVTGPKVLTTAFFEELSSDLSSSHVVIFPATFAADFGEKSLSMPFCVHEFHHQLRKKDVSILDIKKIE